mgnify:CR=1 FL=1
MLDYIRDGQEIYRNSFAIIRAEARLERIPADLEKLAVRVIHACGMVEAIDGLQFSEGAGKAGREALAAGAPILCDARMVSEGVTRARLPANNEVICTLRDGAALTQLAAWLTDQGFGASALTVLECLGGPDQRIHQTTAATCDLQAGALVAVADDDSDG